jgi:hypothetical protein
MVQDRGIGVSNLTVEIVHKLIVQERTELWKNILGGYSF